MKNVLIIVVALALTGMAGCASAEPPSAGFGTTVTKIRATSHGTMTIVSVRAGDKCEMWLLFNRVAAPDWWFPFGEVPCAALEQLAKP